MDQFIRGLGLFLLLICSLGILGTCSAEEEDCRQFQMKCNVTGKCIPLSWKCDGDGDCGDGDNSDEQNCPPKTCADQEIQCSGSDANCVPERWQCDGDNDCANGEDEQNCSKNVTCSDDQFTCGKGQCIRLDWKCDGSKDCENGEDEKDCETLDKCTESQFKCKTLDMCISEHWVCDGDKDCADGSDEEQNREGATCEITCKENEFRCADKSKCIDSSWHCDGDVDCPDSSDENQCVGPVNTEQCNPETEFKCQQDGDCIHVSWKCDGSIDCEDGSDEGSHCNYTCQANQFQCNNHFCISDKLRCDGSIDCIDDSDEMNCTKKACKDIGEFDCYGDGSLCIPESRVCDGRNDCQLREDEDPALCKQRNPCETMTCAHHSHCERVEASGQCVCDSGFEWHEVGQECKDINECETRGMCSQICTNRVGGYKCECKEGYMLEDHYFCRAEGEKSWLYYANRRDIRRIRADSRYMEIVVEETMNSIALDIDFEEHLLFWTDRGAEEIRSAQLNEFTVVANTTTIIKNQATDAFAADGLAVDWLYKHVYWTDTGSNTIKLTDYKGTQVMTLIDSGLDDPRAICLDPENGYMYWSDWGQEPKIERSGMDGSDRTTLVSQADGLEWPNGLTIDYVGKRIYWIDSKLHRIGTANFDGSDIGHVLVDATEINQPFSIAVFEDSLYWTDWHSNSIKSVNKLTGHKPKTISIGSYSVMDIKVYHEKKQEKGFKKNATDLCAAAQCETFCLPKPHSDASKPKEVVCACPNGEALLADQKSCVAKATEKPPVTTQKPAPVTTQKPGETTEKPDTTQAPGETTQGGYTVLPSNKTETVPHEKKEGSHSGMIAIVGAGVAAVILIVTGVIGCLVYRRYKAKNKKSMNFDNPVYRKTTTTEEQCMIQQDEEQPQAITVYEDHA